MGWAGLGIGGGSGSAGLYRCALAAQSSYWPDLLPVMRQHSTLGPQSGEKRKWWLAGKSAGNSGNWIYGHLKTLHTSICKNDQAFYKCFIRHTNQMEKKSTDFSMFWNAQFIQPLLETCLSIWKKCMIGYLEKCRQLSATREARDLPMNCFAAGLELRPLVWAAELLGHAYSIRTEQWQCYEKSTTKG